MLVEVDESQSLPKLIFARAAERPDDIVAEQRVGVGHWRRVPAHEFATAIRSVARGLHSLGLRRGGHIAILAATSYEWGLLDYAALSLGAVVVPIYESDSAVQIRHILSDAKVSIVITQTGQQAELIRSVKTKAVKHILSLHGDALRTLRLAGGNVPEEIIDEGIEKTTLSDVATLIYTSGTTGLPKGVILTHGNFVRPLLQANVILPHLIDDPKARVLLFLPVAHVLARFVMHGVLIGKGRVGFSPDTRTLLQDIADFEPTSLLAVPRVLEKVYNSASAKAGGGFKSKVFAWSALQSRKVSEATAYPIVKKRQRAADVDDATLTSSGPKLGLRVAHRTADTLVLGKIKKLLGPRLDMVICGGAPLSVDLAHFFRGLGITLLQGYGLSETTGPITVELPGDNPPHSVGYLWPGNEMKLADDNELLLRGISVSPGYHNLRKATEEAFKDGWFHTGDLAEIDAEGRLSITGRKKELLVTAGGKNVSPEVLEQSLLSHPLIGQVIVVGDGQPYIGALVTLDPEMLRPWLRNRGLPVVEPHVASSTLEVRESISRAIARANQNVSRAESIRRFRILNADFTVENGYLTPSLKLKRHRVLKDFAEDIEALYDMTPEELAGTGGTVEPPATSIS